VLKKPTSDTNLPERGSFPIWKEDDRKKPLYRGKISSEKREGSLFRSTYHQDYPVRKKSGGLLQLGTFFYRIGGEASGKKGEEREGGDNEKD